MHVALDLAVDVVEALGHQGRAGRAEAADGGERMRVDRRQPGLVARIDEFRRGAEPGHALGIGEIEDDVAGGVEGRAVIEQQRRLAGKRRGEPVPHHPAAGGEPEHPVARLDVAHQFVLAEMLEQHAADAVDDAFRHAGGARREQDVERAVERHRREFHRPRVDVLHEFVPQPHVADIARVGLRRDVGHQQHAPDGGQLGEDVGQLGDHRMRLAAIMIAVHRHQEFRLDLAEPVDHALDAEIRRARGKRGAEAGGGQHGDDGLRHIRHIGGNAVAGAQPLGAEGLLQPRHGRVQRPPAHASPHLVLAPEYQGVAVVAPAQEVFGEVELRIGEEAGARHLVAVHQHALPARHRLHAAELPDAQPEFLRLGDRPSPQAVMVGRGDAEARGGEMHERRHVRGGDAVRRWGPKRRFGHGQSPAQCKCRQIASPARGSQPRACASPSPPAKRRGT